MKFNARAKKKASPTGEPSAAQTASHTHQVHSFSEYAMGLSERTAVAINGFTKAELARKMGVTGSAVTQWLTGDTKSLKASVAQDLERVTGYGIYKMKES